MAGTKLKFISEEHEEFYNEMLKKFRVNDNYHRSFFYCMGLSEITRKNICMLYDFEKGYAEPDGLHGGWQTGGTRRLTYLALNLWNGYTEPGEEGRSTPYEIFDCEYAPYFYEAIKLRYPEYCLPLSVDRDDSFGRGQER